MVPKRTFNFERAQMLIEKLPLLKGAPPLALKECLREAHTSLVRAGKRIFKEGEIGTDAIFVARGLVSLSKDVPPERRVTVELAGTGEPLGVPAVLDSRPFPLEAIAFTETSLLYIPKANFQALAEEYPKILKDLYAVVGARFRKAQERIAQLVSAGARTCVVAALDMLLERPEVCGENDTVATSRKQLAELAGVTTETCIRMTSVLEKEEVVSFPGSKRIRINRERLGHALVNDEE